MKRLTGQEKEFLKELTRESMKSDEIDYDAFCRQRHKDVVFMFYPLTRWLKRHKDFELLYDAYDQSPYNVLLLKDDIGDGRDGDPADPELAKRIYRRACKAQSRYCFQRAGELLTRAAAILDRLNQSGQNFFVYSGFCYELSGSLKAHYLPGNCEEDYNRAVRYYRTALETPFELTDESRGELLIPEVEMTAEDGLHFRLYGCYYDMGIYYGEKLRFSDDSDTVRLAASAKSYYDAAKREWKYLEEHSPALAAYFDCLCEDLEEHTQELEYRMSLEVNGSDDV